MPPPTPDKSKNSGCATLIVAILVVFLVVFFGAVVIAAIGNFDTATPPPTVTTSTTEAPPSSDEVYGDDFSLAAFQITACGIRTDLCSMSDADAAEMAGYACDVLDAVDPYWTKTQDEVAEAVAILVLNEASSYDEADAMASIVGAVYGLRGDLCS